MILGGGLISPVREAPHSIPTNEADRETGNHMSEGRLAPASKLRRQNGCRSSGGSIGHCWSPSPLSSWPAQTAISTAALNEFRSAELLTRRMDLCADLSEDFLQLYRVLRVTDPHFGGTLPEGLGPALSSYRDHALQMQLVGTPKMIAAVEPFYRASIRGVPRDLTHDDVGQTLRAFNYSRGALLTECAAQAGVRAESWNISDEHFEVPGPAGQ
jgi:hypothetical protein